MEAAEKNQRKAAELAEANSGASSVYTLILKGNLANFLSNRGRLREAIEICDDVLRNLPPPSDASGRSRLVQGTTRILADAWRRLGYPLRAVEELQAASTAAPVGQDSPVQTIVVELARAHALLDLGRCDACEKALLTAASTLLAKEIKDPICKARMVGLQVRLALAQGRLPDAIEAWRIRNDGASISEKDAIEDDARLALAMGEPARACEVAERGLTLNTLANGGTRAPYQRLELLLVLAQARLECGDFDAALEAVEEALHLNASFADIAVSPDRIRALGILAHVQLARGFADLAGVARADAAAIRARNPELGPQILATLAHP
jgi:tetratricopeptide (TPR) repeat protein